MIDLFWLLLVTLECLALGWIAGVTWPGPRAPQAMLVALRILAGMALLGFTLVVWLVLELPLGLAPVVLAAAAGLAFRVRVHGRNQPPNQAVSWTAEPLEIAGWVLLGVVLAAAALRAWIIPEAAWDAYSHWGLKALAFFTAGGFVGTGTAHEYYPPLVPLLEAWLYTHRGAADIDVAKLLWPVVGSAFGVCLAWHFRITLREAWLAPFLALGVLLGTPQLLESFWTGEADILLTVMLCLAALAVFQSYRLGRPTTAWLIQAALFCAAAALAKHEGLFRVGVLVAAILVEAFLARRSDLTHAALVCGAVGLVAFLPWAAFRMFKGIEVTSEHMSALQPGAVLEVLGALVVTFGGVRTGGGLVIVVLSAVAAGAMLLRPPMRLLTLVVAAQLGATLLAFLITDTSPEMQVRLSATRLFQHWMPLALFVSGVCLAELLPARINVAASLRPAAVKDRETASV